MRSSYFQARVGNRDVDGVDLVQLGSEGLVAELTVFVRPLSGLVALGDAVAARVTRPS